MCDPEKSFALWRSHDQAPRDPAQLAKLMIDIASGEVEDLPPTAKQVRAHKAGSKGGPDPKHISTSFSERSNLNMRMHTRRFTRLTNAFSKKVEHHAHSVALPFCQGERNDVGLSRIPIART